MLNLRDDKFKTYRSIETLIILTHSLPKSMKIRFIREALIMPDDLAHLFLYLERESERLHYV
jgi:hypothetical protein